MEKGRNQENGKKFAAMCQWTYGNVPPRSTDVMKWHRGPWHQKCQI